MKTILIVSIAILLILLTYILFATTRNSEKLGGTPSLIEAVRNRDVNQVNLLIESGADIEERDYRGSTPLRIAAGSDQNIIAEMLLEAGADPFSYDSLYISAASGFSSSRLLPGTPEGDALQRNLSRLEEAGVPIPPPTRSELKELVERGDWPAKSAPAPLEN